MRRSELTIVAAENKVVDGLQAKECQEVPRQTGNPSDVQIPSPNTRLKHGLELRCQREGKFHCHAVSVRSCAQARVYSEYHMPPQEL